MATKPQDDIRLTPLHEEDEDARYRVRDKHTTDDLGKIWGEDLTWEAAHNLKERITSSGRSTTARIESMEVDHYASQPVAPPKPVRPAPSAVVTKPNHPSPPIANNQARAIAAGRAAAAAAQARAEKLARDRELVELATQAASLQDAADANDANGAGDAVLDGEIDELGGESAEFQ